MFHSLRSVRVFTQLICLLTGYSAVSEEDEDRTFLTGVGVRSARRVHQTEVGVPRELLPPSLYNKFMWHISC
jgi:hypothetical protein